MARPASYAYVPNERSATVTSTGTGQVVARGRSIAVAVIVTPTCAKPADIAVGELPWGVAIR